MNALDRFLVKFPQSSNEWHCPWFWVIEGLAINGTVFGAIAYVSEDAHLGLVAAAIGIFSGSVALGSRERGGQTC